MGEGEKIHGCRLKTLSGNACRNVVGWACGGPKPEGMGIQFKWLLAHSVDGVTWGKVNGDDQWALGSGAFPGCCPSLQEDKLLELRLFGPDGEVLVWNGDEGFSGRILEDVQVEGDEPCVTPEEEDRILLGDRRIRESRSGFSRVGTGDGREQVVPLECSSGDFSRVRWPLRLKVRHYFKQDEETGAVRVAATRVVDVYKEQRR